MCGWEKLFQLFLFIIPGRAERQIVGVVVDCRGQRGGRGGEIRVLRSPLPSLCLLEAKPSPVPAPKAAGLFGDRAGDGPRGDGDACPGLGTRRGTCRAQHHARAGDAEDGLGRDAEGSLGTPLGGGAWICPVHQPGFLCSPFPSPRGFLPAPQHPPVPICSVWAAPGGFQ